MGLVPKCDKKLKAVIRRRYRAAVEATPQACAESQRSHTLPATTANFFQGQTFCNDPQCLRTCLLSARVTSS